MQVDLKSRRARKNIFIPQCIIEARQDDVCKASDWRVALRRSRDCHVEANVRVRMDANITSVSTHQTKTRARCTYGENTGPVSVKKAA